MELLEKALKSLGLKPDRLSEVLEVCHLKHLDDLYAAVGRGDVKLSQILNRLTSLNKAATAVPLKIQKKPQPGRSDLRIEGVGQLLTHIARCCKPLPGEEVIGYITLGRGVAVHRRDCRNILQAKERQQERLLDVCWGEGTRDVYAVDLIIKAFDRPALLRDITSLLSSEKAHVFALQTLSNREDNTVRIEVTVEIDGFNSLDRLLSRMLQIPNVSQARRVI